MTVQHEVFDLAGNPSAVAMVDETYGGVTFATVDGRGVDSFLSVADFLDRLTMLGGSCPGLESAGG